MKKLIVEIQNNNETLIEINNVLSLNFGALDRGDITETTNWGLFSNKGEFSFIDTNNTFKSVVSSYSEIDFCIYYVSGEIKKLLATFLIDDYDYNEETKKVIVTLKDNLIKWQDHNIGDYYTFVRKSIGDIWGDVFGDDTRVTDQALLNMSASIVNTSLLRKASKWSNADKICQATMTRCFCDFDGTPLFSDETPKQFNNIVIRPRNILSFGNKIGKEKTKLEFPSISAYNITKHENEAISNEVPFVFYNIRGVEKQNNKTLIVADWVNYSANVTTSKYIDLDIPSRGGFVYAKIKKPNNFFSADSVDVTVNVATTSSDSSKIQRTTKTTNAKKAQEQGYEIYAPYDVSANPYGEYISVTVQDTKIAYPYQVSLEKLDIVGTYCIADGSITVLGNFFTEDGETTVGSADKNSTTLQSNELIQTESRYLVDDIQQKSLAEHIIDTVIQKYINGLECVELEVTPSEYYDIDGNNVISPNGYKPLFEKYDIVTPYVIKNGFEQPYSLKNDGEAKSFKIIGIEYSFQGFLRQKLYLQETTNLD